jgi:hypothetical protein
MLRKLSLLTLPLVLLACEHSATAPDHAFAAEEPAPRAQAAAAAGLTLTKPADDPGPPFYVRTLPPPQLIFTVDGWAVFQFYRDPGCVPEGFNLLEFFDAPAAFACTPTVEGFTLVEPGTVVPKVARNRGLGAVPYWFVPTDVAQAAIQDGVLTIGELAGLPGRLVGYASSFSEMQHASAPPVFGGGGHKNPMLSQSAMGALEDGRGFEYHLTELDGVVKAINLRFE